MVPPAPLAAAPALLAAGLRAPGPEYGPAGPALQGHPARPAAARREAGRRCGPPATTVPPPRPGRWLRRAPRRAATGYGPPRRGNDGPNSASALRQAAGALAPLARCPLRLAAGQPAAPLRARPQSSAAKRNAAPSGPLPAGPGPPVPRLRPAPGRPRPGPGPPGRRARSGQMTAGLMIEGTVPVLLVLVEIGADGRLRFLHREAGVTLPQGPFGQQATGDVPRRTGRPATSAPARRAVRPRPPGRERRR